MQAVKFRLRFYTMGLGLLANGLLGTGLLNLVGTAAQTGVALNQNETNLQMTRETNKANLEQVKMTNAANAEQAELAYRRSLPINQVANMMAAGMSRPAALAALSGGGSYTAPVMQSGSLERPQVDYSQVIGALERATNIPANAMQFSLQNLQMKDLTAEMQRKQEAHEAELRALNERLERERDDEYRKKYSQNALEMTDKLAARVLELADSKGVNLEDYTDESQLVKDLQLNKERLWRTAPDVARQKVRETVRARAAEARAAASEERSRIASDDAHRKALIDEALAKFDLTEKQRSLIYKLQILANQVNEGRYTIDQLKDEKVLRQAGFENKKEAVEAVAAAENLEAMARKDRARFRANRSDNAASHVGYAIEWLIDKVNPLKGLISTQ